MRLLLISLVASLAVNASPAAARPSTLAMSCGEAAALVASSGAIVLSTGRHTYDRFVAAPGFCEVGKYADRAWAPTADGRRCRLGYICKHRPAPWEEGLFDYDR